MEEKRKKRTAVITAVALAQLAAAVAFGIYGSFKHVLTSRQGDILIGASLFLFWVLMDVDEPILLHRFDGITARQKSAYLKFAAFDFAGLAGLGYFLFTMGSVSGNGILGAVVYAVSIKLKRENQDIFYGITPEESGEEDDEAGAEPEQETLPDGRIAENGGAQAEEAGTESGLEISSDGQAGPREIAGAEPEEADTEREKS